MKGSCGGFLPGPAGLCQCMGIPRGDAPPILFCLDKRECAAPGGRENLRRQNARGHFAEVRGPCESERRVSGAPSALRLAPAVEEPDSRITTAAGNRGWKTELANFYSRAFRFATHCSGGRCSLPGGMWGRMEDLPAALALSAIAPAARSEAERAETAVQANPSTTPSLRRTVYAAPGSFDRRGKTQGRRGHRSPTVPIRTPPVPRKGGPNGPPFRPGIFSFDRPRPFSFRCLEKKMGADSPGTSRPRRVSGKSLTPPARGCLSPPGYRTAAPPPPGPGSGPGST